QAYSIEPEDGQIGVFSHEFGHQLGLPDLYGNTGTAVGAFSIMSVGAWAGVHQPGDHPTHFDAWCKMRLGFLTPTRITTNHLGASLPPVEQTPAAWRLWTNGDSTNEYFLIENREYVGSDNVHELTLDRGGGPRTVSPGLPSAG